YGYNRSNVHGVRPVLALKSKLVLVRTLPAGFPSVTAVPIRSNAKPVSVRLPRVMPTGFRWRCQTGAEC
ncbi:MAG: hypothetical protein PHV59_07845, partial [Victivallales bacterium]|nr:hypothetical protein [Victivallales bacterium]